MPPQSPLHQKFVRSLTRNGRPLLRIVASNEPIRVGPLARATEGGPDAAA